MMLPLERGQRIDREQILRKLVEIQYERNDHEFTRGIFRVRGDIVEVYPSYEDRRSASSSSATRSTSSITFDPLTGKTIRKHDKVAIYPKTHFVTSRDRDEGGRREHQGGARRGIADRARSRKARCSRRTGCTSGRCSISR